MTTKPVLRESTATEEVKIIPTLAEGPQRG